MHCERVRAIMTQHLKERKSTHISFDVVHVIYCIIIHKTPAQMLKMIFAHTLLPYRNVCACVFEWVIGFEHRFLIIRTSFCWIFMQTHIEKSSVARKIAYKQRSFFILWLTLALSCSFCLCNTIVIIIGMVSSKSTV